MNINEPIEAQRTIAELLHDLSSELQTLVRKELELARLELSKSGKVARKTAGFFGTAALFGLGAFATFTFALIELLKLTMPLWGAALSVTILYGIIAGTAAFLGREKLQNLNPMPESALRNVREDLTTIKESAERGR